MAKTSDKSIVVTLGSPQPKKHVTRFDDTSKRPDTPLRSIYVDNQALDNIGNPAKIKVTIEAA